MAGSFGVHPKYNKDSTSGKAIEVMPTPETLYVLMHQHIGAPCEPIVKAGDEVKAYQKIGDSKAFISAAIHSPVNGKVKQITDWTTPLGTTSQAVVIEVGKEHKDKTKELKYDGYDAKKIVEKVKEAGIVGMGGAMFPTHVKLSPPPDKKIDTIIINAAECEPYLTADHRLMLEYPEEINKGIKIMKKALNPEKVYVAIEDNKSDAIELLKNKLESEITILETKYPQGAEKTQIEQVTGRVIPSGALPMDVGCVVQNVSTVKAIYDAVALEKPLVERVTTVTGDAVKDPKNVMVKVGTLFSEVLDYCGGLQDAKKIISGGPMMGMAQYSLDAPTVKGTSGILGLNKIDELPQTACIRCAKCIDVCPMNLMPINIYKLVDDVRIQAALDNGLMDCVECGCCSFSCPSKINHVHYMKLGKLKARKIKAKEETKK